MMTKSTKSMRYESSKFFLSRFHSLEDGGTLKTDNGPTVGFEFLSPLSSPTSEQVLE